MKLRDATIADIDFVMATERLPGYEASVGRWEREVHAAELASPASAYLIAEEGGAAVAFALLQALTDPNGNVYLKRFAVTRQGEGIGSRALRLTQDWVFARPSAHRYYLHFAVTNERGRRLYFGAGFQQEGVERDVYRMPDGTRVDSIQVSILRPEWQKLRGM
jgi:RimJ/RimL family protein N-acetyltransferase